ncbi:MAG: NAD(P)H-hydrate dehydratase [Burkholderiales bacterium]|nr:NAD(P)H-hydrate dehydratase [Burkholderiales bacterium]
MNNFLTLAQLRAVEQESVVLGIDLIERAGIATAKWTEPSFNKKNRILILAGRGNNGCDGLSAAIELIKLGYKVDVVRLFKDNTIVNDQWFARLQALKKPLVRIPSDISKYDLIIDAIYGIGLTHELDVDTARIIQKINAQNAFVLSLDVPSGLNPFSGRVLGEVVFADACLTFISDKPGLHTADGLDCSGDVHVIDLIDVAPLKLPDALHSIQFNTLADINYDPLLRMKFNTNKGSYGTVAIIGGNKGMHGALYLAGRAALLAGAGKVVLGALDSDFHLDFTMPELMSQSPKEIVKNLQAFDAIAIGPGLGKDEKSYKILNKLLDDIEDSKLLVDADALNLIAADHDLKLKFREVRYKIITPHPGEAARILGVTVNEVQDNRFMSVTDLVDSLNSVTVLKGAGTLIQQNNQIYINATGNPGLASAGQGDTLTGIIAGFLAQGMELLDATRLAVFIHGLAADRLIVRRNGYNGILASMVASEVCDLINELVYGELFKAE